MILTYKEFINNVPKETVDYVNKALKLINHFVVLKKEKLSTISNIDAKISCVLLVLKYQLDNDNLTRIFLDKYKIRKDYEFALFDVDEFFKYEEENIKYEEIFSKFAHIFCVYDSLEQYTLLTPERIILDNGDSAGKGYNFHSDIEKIFDSQFSISDFYGKYNEIVINLEKQNLNSFKDELYKDLSSDLIVFLEKCAEIYHYFDKKVIFDENDSDDFVVMSFINAIFISINTLDLVKYFQSVGIDYDAIKRAFNFNYFETSDLFIGFDKSLIINKYFKKYLFEGVNKNISEEQLSIVKIMSNVFDRNFTNSLKFESLLSSCNVSLDRFNNFEMDFNLFIKNEKIKNIKSVIEPSAINYFNNLAKIYVNLSNIFDENEVDDDMIKNHSLILSLFLERANISNRLLLLNKRGIFLDGYLNFIKINIAEFNRYKNIPVDYEVIGKNFEDYYTLKNGLGELQITSIMKKIFAKDENGCYKYNDYFESLNQDSAIISDEINVGEEIVIPIPLAEQINYFSNLPVNKLDYDIVNISSFGRELAEHSNVIAQESLKLASLDDSELVCDIQEEFNKLNQKPKFSLFNRKLNNELKIENNKKVLNDLNKFLEQKEIKMIEEVKNFCHLKKLIAIYIYRLNGYITELENAIKNIENNQFDDNSILFENLDIQIIKQILYSKLEDFKKSLIINTQEYQKINLMLGSHAVTISKISTVRNTTLPNLYIEMSIQDGLISEQESIQSLNDINVLLDNMINTNEELLRNNLKAKNALNNSNIVITDEMNESINSILVGEHIIENDVKKLKK